MPLIWQCEVHELLMNSLSFVGVYMNILTLPCFIMLSIIMLFFFFLQGLLESGLEMLLGEENPQGWFLHARCERFLYNLQSGQCTDNSQILTYFKISHTSDSSNAFWLQRSGFNIYLLSSTPTHLEQNIHFLNILYKLNFEMFPH